MFATHRRPTRADREHFSTRKCRVTPEFGKSKVVANEGADSRDACVDDHDSVATDEARCFSWKQKVLPIARAHLSIRRDNRSAVGNTHRRVLGKPRLNPYLPRTRHTRQPEDAVAHSGIVRSVRRPTSFTHLGEHKEIPARKLGRIDCALNSPTILRCIQPHGIRLKRMKVHSAKPTRNPQTLRNPATPMHAKGSAPRRDRSITPLKNGSGRNCLRSHQRDSRQRKRPQARPLKNGRSRSCAR